MCPCFHTDHADTFWRMMDNTHEKISVEICRPGCFKSMEGQTITFSEKVLADIASQYRNDDAPVVIGHPDTTAPAYAWVKSLNYDGKKRRLVADLDKIESNFAKAVKAGRYKKISASFFQPGSPANPKPGHFYLRHVGFLGAAAPAIPGLKPVSFAGATTNVTTLNVDFSEMNDNKSILARLKNWLVEKFGAEQAALLTDDEAAKILADNSEDDNGDKIAEVKKPKLPPVNDNDEEKKKANTSLSEKAFSEREHAIAEREKEIAEREKKAVHVANSSFADTLVAKGSLLPVNKDKLVSVLDAVDMGATAVSFADSQQKPGDIFRQILLDQPEIVHFGEALPKSGATESVSFAAPDNYSVDPDRLEIHNAALRIQRKTPTISYEDAVKAAESGDF